MWYKQLRNKRNLEQIYALIWLKKNYFFVQSKDWISNFKSNEA